MSSSSDEEIYNDGSAPAVMFNTSDSPMPFSPNMWLNDPTGGGKSKKKDKKKAAAPNGTETNNVTPKEEEVDTSKLELKFVDQTYVYIRSTSRIVCTFELIASIDGIISVTIGLQGTSSDQTFWILKQARARSPFL